MTAPCNEWRIVADKMKGETPRGAILDELMNARIVFWTCPTREHRLVSWVTVDGKMIPACDECGTQGEPR